MSTSLHELPGMCRPRPGAGAIAILSQMWERRTPEPEAARRPRRLPKCWFGRLVRRTRKRWRRMAIFALLRSGRVSQHQTECCTDCHKCAVTESKLMAILAPDHRGPGASTATCSERADKPVDEHADPQAELATARVERVDRRRRGRVSGRHSTSVPSARSCSME